MKKFLSMSLIVAMTVATLTGCGGGSTEEKGGADTLKIGSMGPITGGAAYYGTEVKQGAQIAIDEINEAGGINGIKVEFNFQDDEADAENGMRVVVEHAHGETCDRCRIIKEEVGTIEAAPTLCSRCADIVINDFPEALTTEEEQ